tara:strand:- start:3175 stop:4284 length:1110 start_codon:yes stop_codon:yes gene_type:complete
MRLTEEMLIEAGLLDTIKGVFGKAFGALSKSVTGAVNKAMGAVEGFLKDGENKWRREFEKTVGAEPEALDFDKLDPSKPRDKVIILNAALSLLKDSSEQIDTAMKEAVQIDAIPADENDDNWANFQKHVDAWVAVKGILNFYIKRMKLKVELGGGFEKDAPDDPASACEAIIKNLEQAMNMFPGEYADAIDAANKESEGSFDSSKMLTIADEATNAARTAIQSTKDFGEKVAELMKDVEGVQESALRYGLLRYTIRETILKEEIGRNYHTLDTDPYTWKDYSDVDVEVYANAEDGTYSSKVSCISQPNLSTPERKFPDEQSASHWARQQSERIFRKTLNSPREDDRKLGENPIVGEAALRKLIRDLILS